MICEHCDGMGRTLAQDWDEHGCHAVEVTCEGCEGTGALSECRECREVMPAGERLCRECRRAA